MLFERVAAAPILALALMANCLAAADPERHARWRADLRFLAAELPRVHPNFFLETSRAEFDRAVAELDGRIPDLRDSEVIAGFARVVAMARDGHTRIRNLPFLPLPVAMEWFEDGLVVKMAPVEFRRAIGGRVVAIGGMPVAEAHRRVAEAISYETEMGLLAASPRYLTLPEVLQAAGVTKDPGRATYTIAPAEGDPFDLELVRGPAPELAEAPVYGAGYVPRVRRQPDRYYWVEYLPAQRVVYFAYNACQEQPGFPFFLTLREAMALLDANPGAEFVVDLRNNEGGSEAVVAPLVRELVARRSILDGKLFALAGRHTFSAGVSAAVDLADRAGARIVGEIAGGAVNGTGNVAEFVLPWSRLAIVHGTALFRKRPRDGPLVPDIRVPRWAGDFFSRYDAGLGAVFNDPLQPAPSAPASAIEVVNAISGRSPVAPGTVARASGDFGEPGGLILLVDGEQVDVLSSARGKLEFIVPTSLAEGPHSIAVQRRGSAVAEGTMVVAAASVAIGAATVDGDTLEIVTAGTEGREVRVWIGEDEATVARRESSRWFIGEKLIVELSASARSGPYPVTVSAAGAVSNAVTATF